MHPQRIYLFILNSTLRLSLAVLHLSGLQMEEAITVVHHRRFNSWTQVTHIVFIFLGVCRDMAQQDSHILSTREWWWSGVEAYVPISS